MTDYHPQGYPKLAQLMSKAKSVAIFRRFDDLNLLCLLSLQAEIVQLEKEYRIECFADDTWGNNQAKQYTSNFRIAHSSENSQITKLRAIRELLKEYNELLIQISDIGQIDKPLKSQLSNLRSWLDQNSFLTGYEAMTWHDSDHARDYVCLEPLGQKGDPFTKFLLSWGIWLYDRAIGRFIPCRGLGGAEAVDPQLGARNYTSDAVNRASNIMTAIMASALPVLAIFALNKLDTLSGRIGATVGFTVAFAVMMGLFSSAKRSEMIAATATFAAIEVVFIGTALASGDTNDGGNAGNVNCTCTLPS